MKRYLRKMKGSGRSAPRTSMCEIFWSWVGSFVGIGAVAGLHWQWAQPGDLVMIIGSFGASAVLLYGAVEAPLSQPRNLIGGHFFSALVGVASYHYMGNTPVLAAAVAVSVAIVVMHVTKTLHPPGGATALIAVIGSDHIHALGYEYAFIPVLSGALVMLGVALVINNMVPSRVYPQHWL